MAKSLDKAVKDIAKELAEETIEKEMNKFIESQSEELTYQDPELKELSSQELVIDGLLSTIPRSEGYYIKLYKEVGSGKFEYKERIDDYEHWTDLESEIVNIIKAKTKQFGNVKWGSGKYKLMVFKEGERGFHKKPVTFLIDADEEMQATKETDNFQYKLQEMGNFMKQIKEVTQPETTALDIHSTSKLITESFKEGMNLMKNSIPQEKTQNPMELITAVLTIIEKLGFFNKPQQQDPFDLLLKMKQLGMIKMAGEDTDKEKDDPIEQVSRITELIHAVAPFTGNVSAEKPSAIMELVRILGPQVPKIVENITGTINKVAEISKIKTAERFGLNPAEIEHMPQMTEEIPLQETSIKKSEVPASMNPIVKQIHDAVNNNDITYYAQLQNLMKIYVNKDIIENLISGEVVIESFLTSLSTMLNQPFLTDDKTKLYFTNFIEHFKAEKEANTIIAKCLTCETEYAFSTLTDFELDTKICDCGGMLEAVKKSTSNNGAKVISGNKELVEEVKS